MISQTKIKRFLFPKVTKKFLLRILLISLLSYILFTHIFIPMRIHGYSMEPTYTDGAFNFCFTLGYLFSMPKRYDIVAIRFAGKRVMLLKRVVAVEGEQVEFKRGLLFVNGVQIEEPYLKYPADWTLPPRYVKQNYVYVVGDNRNVPIQKHHFGQTPINRIVGKILW